MTRERNRAYVQGTHADQDTSSFGSIGPDYKTRGQTEEYDALARYNEQVAKGRAAEARELDRMVRLLSGAPEQLRQEQRTATGEMRRTAALNLAAQGGRGNTIGAGSAAKMVGQEAANIGSRFGEQIRSAATSAAKAKVEREQQRLESMAKPGVDVERVSGELRTIVDRNRRDATNIYTFGMAGQAAKPTALADELNALERSTKDPLALAQIRRVKSNLEAGRDPFEGIA